MTSCMPTAPNAQLGFRRSGHWLYVGLREETDSHCCEQITKPREPGRMTHETAGSGDSSEQVEACLVSINHPLLHRVMKEGTEAGWVAKAFCRGKDQLILSMNLQLCMNGLFLRY